MCIKLTLTNGKMAKWQNGKMAKWQIGKLLNL